MGKTKIIEVSITALRITSEDGWLKNYIFEYGDSVQDSPQFRYLIGHYKSMLDWMLFRNLPTNYITRQLMRVLKSIIYEGQLEPIQIYEDMRINTGHKRSACKLFLGHEKIKAIIVPDDYKL